MYKYQVIECPFDKKKSKYSSLSEIGKNFALIEIIESYQKKESEI